MNATLKNADEVIFHAIQPGALKSFFLFAGAGSGKTRSLVNALTHFRTHFGLDYRIQHRQICVITYTKAASNVIRERLEFDPLYTIATIHHFCWELIQHYQSDIREWREQELSEEIKELEAKLATGRGSQEDRRNKLVKAKQRLEFLPQIKKFVYNPAGENRTKDSLSHSQVIKIATDLLQNQPLLREIMVNKYPIMFIDEAQDTKKELINVLFEVQKEHAGNFSLGLFGDTMQRIYLDGKEGLGQNLPSDWLRPEKTVNYRCPQRVVSLINQIRSQVDRHQQSPHPGQPNGFAHLFIFDSSNANRINSEEKVGIMMRNITSDAGWNSADQIKKLILEHHMAASRLNFSGLYESLNEAENYKNGLLDGTLPSLQVFLKQVVPLIAAFREENEYEVMRIVKAYSPFFDKKVLRADRDQLSALGQIQIKVEQLTDLWKADAQPTISEVATELKKSGLFVIPDVVNLILSRKEEKSEAEDQQISADEEELAWEATLTLPFSQIENYRAYISEASGFGTHQGVKGLEFKRVMVILDDDSARGNLFKYDKLFEVSPLSERDLLNKREGKETGVDRARRLLYVACSRAEESLAIVAYTADPKKLAETAINFGWFSVKEIHQLNE